MEELIDRLFGFLPVKFTFWTGVATLLLILTIQFVNRWLNQILKLPWMKEENQRQRTKTMQSVKQNNNKSNNGQG
ncbi:hypothetical protein ACFFHM_11575 [Halalkalibacter kiskunsagensis]|uniref:Uncharacterized protein n=1 Tax=Halalkalibacter kiskunsagensis TaxID=1548599 RepID=A0ABV6KCW5_9BACI